MMVRYWLIIDSVKTITLLLLVDILVTFTDVSLYVPQPPDPRVVALRVSIIIITRNLQQVR